WILEGGGHDELGHAVQPVGQLATPGWPPPGHPLVAPPTQQQGLGAQRLLERELVGPWAVLDQADPAAATEAFVAGRVLDDSVKGDVVAHDDPSHLGSPSRGLVSYRHGGRRGFASPSGARGIPGPGPGRYPLGD